MTSKKRKILMREAHRLNPMVMLGKQGLTPQVVAQTKESLDHHELIKVRFQDFKDEKRELLQRLAEQTGSELVSLIGHVGILYLRNPDADKRIYHGIPME